MPECPARRSSDAFASSGRRHAPKLPRRRLRKMSAAKPASLCGLPAALHLARDQECKLDGLFAVQSRIHLGLVGPRQVLFTRTARAADAFGDIFARNLHMHAAELAFERAVYVEGLLHFAVNVFEVSCLKSARGGLRVAVHGVANPDRVAAFRLHGLNQ